jgi:NAD-dependent DNA ligase
MIRGIGPVYAKKMVKAFGEKVFDIIEAEPDRLREVTGIGAVRAKRITDAWADQKPRRGHRASREDLQDLRRRRRPGHDRKPLSSCP